MRIRKEDQGLKAGLFWGLAAFLVRWSLILVFQLRIYDVHRVPRRGPAILAANHQSYLDPSVVNACVRRRCCSLARKSLFRVPLLGFLIRRLDAIPVARESRAPREGIRLSLKALEAGRVLVLFPEGTRSRDGSFGRLRRGIALIARRSRAPVVPVWIEGSHQAWPRGRLLPRPVPVRVAFGEALWFDGEKESADAFLKRLRARMTELGAAATAMHPGTGGGVDYLPA